jgi:hypothetical protein
MAMMTRFVHALFLSLIVTAGCSSQPQPAAESPAPPNETAPVETTARTDATIPAEAPPPAAAEHETRAEPASPTPAESAAAPAEEPATVETPTAEPSPPSGTPGHPEGWAVVDIGGEVEVGTTLAGLTRIGATKCKICHKVQYASWAESPHGKRTPPLDCEGCHGPGSAYKGKKVMEDPAAARAAGMVIPERSFCEQCHKGGWTDDLLTRTHEHKAEGS